MIYIWFFNYRYNVYLILIALVLQRHSYKDGTSVETRVSEVIGQVAPSILLTSVSESLAFFIGKFTFSLIKSAARHNVLKLISFLHP